jgi:hypothetical protein
LKGKRLDGPRTHYSVPAGVGASGWPGLQVLVMRPIGIALVLAASSAHAEAPIAVRAGLGITVDLDNDSYQSTHVSKEAQPYGPGFYLDIGYRLIDDLAASVHVDITRNSAIVMGGNITTQTFHHVYTPLHLGVGAQWSVNRFWLAPWMGAELRPQRRAFAFGFGGGVDAYIGATGHRIGAYLDVSDGLAEGDYDLDPLSHR